MKLLERDPKKRIGNFNEIKNHDFFKNLNWKTFNR